MVRSAAGKAHAARTREYKEMVLSTACHVSPGVVYVGTDLAGWERVGLVWLSLMSVSAAHDRKEKPGSNKALNSEMQEVVQGKADVKGPEWPRYHTESCSRASRTSAGHGERTWTHAWSWPTGAGCFGPAELAGTGTSLDVGDLMCSGDLATPVDPCRGLTWG